MDFSALTFNSPVSDSLLQSAFIALSSRARVQDAIDAMAEQHSSCVLVLEQGQLIGIFTERDVVRLTMQGELRAGARLTESMSRDVITVSALEAQDTFALTQRFSQNRIRHLPVVDEQEQLIGIVTPYSLRRSLRPEYLLRHVRVEEVLQQDVIHGFPGDSVWHLSNQMTCHRVSCVVILDPDNHLPVGIVTERDIVKFHKLGLSVEAVLAGEIMSSPLSTVAPSDSLWSVHEQMLALGVRRLVVVHPGGQLAGLVTQTQMLKVLDPVETHRVMGQMQVVIDQQTQELHRLNQALKRSNQALSQLATVDDLTQIANRRRLNEFLQQTWIRLMALKQPLSVLMCDVDYFKVYNDTYGHLAGDECLVKIAGALRSVTWQSSDLVARYGGEEFVVVLPEADGNAAVKVAHRVQTQIAALKLEHSGSLVSDYLTVSLGAVTTMPDTGRSPELLLEAADQLLYQAKQQGRNSYVAKVLTEADLAPSHL